MIGHFVNVSDATVVIAEKFKIPYTEVFDTLIKMPSIEAPRNTIGGKFESREETAREIFAEIDKILDFATEHTPLRMPFQWIDMRFISYYNELKKKYTEEE